MRLLVALVLTCYASIACAQWQVPVNNIPIGRGPGVTGYNSIVTSGTGQCLINNGASAPTFQSCLPNGGTLGQYLIKYDGTNAHANWYTPEAFNISTNPSADCTGVTATVISTVTSGFTNIIIPPGCTLKVSANDTIPATQTLRMACGSRINVDNTFTLQIQAFWFDPGPCRVFGGAGVVTAIRSVRPEYWGAARNGSTDDSASIQAAINSVQASASSAGDEYLLRFVSGTYAIASTVTFTPTATIQWHVKGTGSVNIGGTTILLKASYTGSIGILFAGSTGGSAPVADFKISDLAIVNQTAGSGPTVCLQFGSGTSSNTLNAFKENLAENLYVTGCSTQIAFSSVRFINLYRVGAWPGDSVGTEASNTVPVSLTSSAGVFTGDINLTDCNLVGSGQNGSPTGNVVYMTATGANAFVSGVGIINTVMYGGAIKVAMIATSAGSIVDIWLNPRTQLEGSVGGTNVGLYASSDGAGTRVGDVHVAGVYMSGHGFSNHVLATATNSGLINNFFIRDNFLANSSANKSAVDIRGTGGSCNGMGIFNNEIFGPTSGSASAIYIENCSQVTVNGTMLTGTGGPIPNVVFLNGGSWLTAIGNNSGGLINSTSVAVGTVTNTNIANNN